MVVAKDFATMLEKFEGLDLKSSKLTGTLTTAESLLNLEFSESMSLRGRAGSQPVAQVGGFGHIHSHKYSDPISAASSEELLAFNSTPWRLKTGVLSVTGGANVNWQLTMTPGSQTYRFVIQNGTTPYVLNGNNYYDLGTGLEKESTNALITVEALRSTINANATLACALPAGMKFAQVDGNQAGVSVITVFNTHNYVVGDWAVFYDFGTSQLVARKVSAITGTTISFSTAQFGVVTVKNNQVFGPLAAPAASIRVRDVTTAATDIPFEYWDTVPYTTDLYQNVSQTPWVGNTPSPSSSPHPLFALDDNNECYIYDNTATGLDSSYAGYPFKYDGQTIYREGIPRHTQWSGSASATVGGLSAGTYRYKVAYIQYDARGNIIQGRTTEAASAVTVGAAVSIDLTLSNMMIEYNLKDKGVLGQISLAAGPVNTLTLYSHKAKTSDWVFMIDRATGAYVIRPIATVNSTTSITIGGSAVTVNLNDYIYFARNVGFNYNCAQAAANATQTTLTVYNTAALPNTLRVGDTAYFYDRLVGQHTARLITATTATTITIAGDPISLNNNDPISNNLRVRVWRTKAGGNIFYEVADLVHNALSFNWVYNDGLADVSLGAQLFEPISGKEQDLPPKATIACTHQGTRCSSGDPQNPNTVYIYSTLDREAVPVAYNSFDVPSSMKGPITAIFSDSDDRLAIFKPNAYYQATGALDDNAFTVQTQSEGDRGVSTQHSMARVNNKVVGVGPSGPITVQQGQILADFSDSIYPAFASNADVNYQAAFTVNEPETRHWIVFVPSKNLSDANGLAQSLFFSMDWGNGDAWFDRLFTGSADPAGGMTTYDNNLYWLNGSYGFGASSTYGEHVRVFRRLQLSTSLTTPSNLYWDVNQAIPQVFEPSWFTPYSQPSIDKEFQWFKLFCAPSRFETDKFTAFTPILTTYKDYSDATLVETLTLGTLSTTVFETKKKLLATKMRSILFRVALNTGGTAMFITGFEPVLDPSYVVEQPR